MLTHISNNYIFSTVHSSLANSLAEKGVKCQFVYSPIQRKAKGNPAVESDTTIRVAKPRLFTEWMRYLPLIKVLISFVTFLFTLKKNKVRPRFIIAHNLWSDGMVAWLYHKLTGTPYTVAVRNTDINLFLPKLRHYRWLIRRVVGSAKRTVFINSAYSGRMETYFPTVLNAINSIAVIYNGIDKQWFDSLKANDGDHRERQNQVIYVGSFVANKNIKNSVLAIDELNSNGAEINFILVGGTRVEFLECTGLSQVPDWVTVIPRTMNRELIASHLRNSRVFIMPSFHETFGLVYIEALSQGCCIVHSQNEGIDGVFREPFIKGVDPYSVDDIANKVISLLSQYPSGVTSKDVSRLIAEFSWPHIAEQYLDIINEGIVNE